MSLKPTPFWKSAEVDFSDDVLDREIRALPPFDEMSPLFLSRIVCKIAGHEALKNSGRERNAPPKKWTRLASDWSSVAVDRLCDFTPDALASVLSGFRSMKYKPDDKLWLGMRHYILAHRNGFTGTDLSKIMFATGRLELPVTRDFGEALDALCTKCVQTAPNKPRYMTPNELADALLGLSTITDKPSRHLLSAIEAIQEQELAQFPPRSLSILCKIFNRGRRLPPDGFTKAFVSACLNHADAFGPEAMAGIINGSTAYFPHGNVLSRAFLPIATRKVGSFSADALSFAPTTFAPLRNADGDAFMQRYDVACQIAMPTMLSKPLSRAINSYARTTRVPPPSFIEHFEDRMLKLWKRIHPDDVSRMLLAYALFSIQQPQIAQSAFGQKLLRSALTMSTDQFRETFAVRHKGLFDGFKKARQALVPTLPKPATNDPLQQAFLKEGIKLQESLFTLQPLWACVDCPTHVGQRLVVFQKDQHGPNGDPQLMSAIIHQTYPKAVIVNLTKPVCDELVHPESEGVIKDIMGVVRGLKPQVYEPQLKNNVLSFVPLAETLVRRKAGLQTAAPV